MSKEIFLRLVLPLLFLVVLIGGLKYLGIKNKTSPANRIEKFKQLLETGKTEEARKMLAEAMNNAKVTGSGDEAREMYQLAETAKHKKQGIKQKPREAILPAVNALLDATKAPAIKLYRPYPPPATQIYTSYLGGLPILPPNVEWPYVFVPRQSKDGQSITEKSSMNFLGQINLKELPKNKTLPSTGALYFFANLDGPAQEGNEGAKVIYSESFSVDWGPSLAPENLAERWGKVSEASDLRVFPKWPVRFFETPSFQLEGLSQEFHNKMDDKYSTVYDKVKKQFIGGFWDVYQEELTKRSPIPDLVKKELGRKGPIEPKWMKYIKNEEALILPEHFPSSGAMIDEVAKSVVYFATKKVDDYDASVKFRQKDFGRKLKLYEAKLAGGHSDLEKPEYNPPKEIYGRDMIETLKAEALEWQKTASKIGHKSAPNRAQAEAFCDWLKAIGKLKGPAKETSRGKLHASYIYSNSQVQSAVMEGIKALIQKAIIDTEYANIIPKNYYEDLPHNNLYDNHLTIKHQLLGNPPMRTNPIDIGENDVLLLSLFSDYGVNFLFGDMDQMQFYIDKNDLAARRFEKAWGRAG